MTQSRVIVATSKARTTRVTFNRQQRYTINRSRLVLYMGCLITYSEYLAELAAK